MNIPVANFTTLSPVHWVTAFFAFLGIFLSSCQADQEGSSLAQQTEVFVEMTEVLDGLTEGGDVNQGATKLEELSAELKELKRELSQKQQDVEEGDEALPENVAHREILGRYFDSLSRYQSSSKASPIIFKALESLHDSRPLAGEGSP